MESVKAGKARLRADLLQKRRALSPDEAKFKSSQIASRLLEDPAFLKAGSVHLYLAKAEDREADTTAIIEQCLRVHKAVFVPIITSSGQMRHCRLQNLHNLSIGHFGIPQPPLGDLLTDTALQTDLVLVPGIAFDQKGHRLGYGRGYYDRFLSSRPAWVNTLGLCYADFLLENLPFDSHDVPVQSVVTDMTVRRSGL
jgi:5-formyltetrahydrofolate cyclo-ligase